MNHPVPTRSTAAIQAGATLIEVLVTVAVTSIGLLGIAGLMAVSAKVNHRAYLDTQVNFIAQALIESMHINAVAVADGRYDGAFHTGAARATDCASRGCTSAERAAYDRSQFALALDHVLPDATAQLACTSDAAVGAGTGTTAGRGGICRLEVNRAPPASGVGAGQALVWIFQP